MKRSNFAFLFSLILTHSAFAQETASRPSCEQLRVDIVHASSFMLIKPVRCPAGVYNPDYNCKDNVASYGTLIAAKDKITAEIMGYRLIEVAVRSYGDSNATLTNALKPSQGAISPLVPSEENSLKDAVKKADLLQKLMVAIPALRDADLKTATIQNFVNCASEKFKNFCENGKPKANLTEVLEPLFNLKSSLMPAAASDLFGNLSMSSQLPNQYFESLNAFLQGSVPAGVSQLSQKMDLLLTQNKKAQTCGNPVDCKQSLMDLETLKVQVLAEAEKMKQDFGKLAEKNSDFEKLFLAIKKYTEPGLTESKSFEILKREQWLKYLKEAASSKTMGLSDQKELQDFKKNYKDITDGAKFDEQMAKDVAAIFLAKNAKMDGQLCDQGIAKLTDPISKKDYFTKCAESLDIKSKIPQLQTKLDQIAASLSEAVEKDKEFDALNRGRILLLANFQKLCSPYLKDVEGPCVKEFVPLKNFIEENENVLLSYINKESGFNPDDVCSEMLKLNFPFRLTYCTKSVKRTMDVNLGPGVRAEVVDSGKGGTKDPTDVSVNPPVATNPNGGGNPPASAQNPPPPAPPAGGGGAEQGGPGPGPEPGPGPGQNFGGGGPNCGDGGCGGNPGGPDGGQYTGPSGGPGYSGGGNRSYGGGGGRFGGNSSRRPEVFFDDENRKMRSTYIDPYAAKAILPKVGYEQLWVGGIKGLLNPPPIPGLPRGIGQYFVAGFGIGFARDRVADTKTAYLAYGAKNYYQGRDYGFGITGPSGYLTDLSKAQAKKFGTDAQAMAASLKNNPCLSPYNPSTGYAALGNWSGYAANCLGPTTGSNVATLPPGATSTYLSFPNPVSMSSFSNLGQLGQGTAI